METEKCWGVVNSYGDVIYWTVTEKSPEEAWAIFTNIWPEKIKDNWVSRVARKPRLHVISKFKEWIVTSPTPLDRANELIEKFRKVESLANLLVNPGQFAEPGNRYDPTAVQDELRAALAELQPKEQS